MIYSLVAINENKFYYDAPVNDYFDKMFPEKNGRLVQNKMYLWHWFEEIEHHQESVDLYRSHFGNKVFWLLPLTAPIYFALWYCILIFSFVLSLVSHFNSNGWHSNGTPLTSASVAARFLGNVANFFYDLVLSDVSGIISLLLLVAGLSTTDEKIQDDLGVFRDRFRERYGDDLTMKSDTVDTKVDAVAASKPKLRL